MFARAAAAAESGADLGDAQPRRLARAGRGGQHAHHVAVGKLRDGLRCAREVLPERVAQPVGLAVAVPDELLVGAGEDAHRARFVAVACDRPVVVAVGAHEVGEQLGVAGAGLGAADVVAVAVAGHRARVDGVDPVAGRDQRRDPGAAVRLDTDHDFARAGGVLRDQCVQRGDPRDAFGQPPGSEALTGFVHEMDVVVVLGPVVAHVQSHRGSPPHEMRAAGCDPAGWSTRRPHDQCSMARHPRSALDNPDYQPGLGLSVEIRRPRKQLRAHRLAGLGPVSRIKSRSPVGTH